MIGGQITDSATVTGRFDPQQGATVEFRAYGPNDAGCANSPAFTSSVSYPVAGGPVSSAAVTPATGRVNPLPGGTVTFDLYGPDDVTCSRAAVISAVVSLPTDANTVSSPLFTPTAPGRYRWRAADSGDTNNPAVQAPCNEPNESVYVEQRPTIISTTASTGIVVGSGALTDSAVVLGRGTPVSAATVSFVLYGPEDPTCSRPVFESPGIPYPLAGGPVESGPFTPTIAGTYRWRAVYSGDATNAPATDICDAETERVVVAKATPTLNATAGPGILVGETLSNNVVVSGLVNPQANGTVGIALYGPVTGATTQAEATCSGVPIFQLPGVPYSVAGALVRASFRSTATGLFGWRATYSGDVNNNAVTGRCNEVNVRGAAIVLGPELPETGRDTTAMILVASASTSAGLLMLLPALRRRRRSA